MKKLVVAASLAVASIAGTAHAAPTPAITFNTNATATNPQGTNVIYNFDLTPAGTPIGQNSFVTNISAMGAAVRPAVFSSGNYAEASGAGTFTLNFAPTNILSFALGSLDPYNTLTLTFSDLSTVVLADGAIVGGASGRDGVVTYTTLSGSPLLTGATFTSSANAFEIDNVAVGVPEPAAWGMMILGFGLVGGVLRRRAPAKAKVKFA